MPISTETVSGGTLTTEVDTGVVIHLENKEIEGGVLRLLLAKVSVNEEKDMALLKSFVNLESHVWHVPWWDSAGNWKTSQSKGMDERFSSANTKLW